MGRAGRDPHGTSAPAILGTLSPLCATHPGDTVTIETAADAGWEGWGMWQPPNPPGVKGTVPTAPPKNHIAALPMHPPCPPIGHPSLGRAASPQLHLGPSGMCPALGWVTGSMCQLCQALPSRAARSRQAALLLGAQTQNLKDCLDLLNVAAFVCFLASVFQILRFLPSVLQIFRV